jgi:hypothetical protein
MPLIDLTAEELRDAAMAARAAASRAQQDSAAQPNPRISLVFAADAERYTRLGRKFETARPSYREGANRQQNPCEQQGEAHSKPPK